MASITCRKCGNSESGTFSYRVSLIASAFQDEDGQWETLLVETEGRERSLSCGECGHSWRTRRHIEAAWPR